MPSTSEINLQKFSAQLRAKRSSRGLREVADEIGGVSASTLSRIEQGNVPDLETFLRLCRWLQVSPEEFMGSPISGKKSKAQADRAVDTPQTIEAHLRADRILPSKTIDALSEMIRLAYRAASEGKLGGGKKK